MYLKQHSHTFSVNETGQIDILSLAVTPHVTFEADKAEPLYTQKEADHDRKYRSYMVWNAEVGQYETYDEYGDAIRPLLANEWGCTHFYWMDPHFDGMGRVEAVTVNIVYEEE